MKACPVCGRMYPDDGAFCPVDGSGLISATQAPIMSVEDDARIGQLVCQRYQLRRVVADGGMGRVYEALDMHERRNVAVKILHADVARDEVQVERFKREFEVSELLPHSHIVEVMDFQATSDQSYALAMEFLYGEELRSCLKREKVMPPARVVRMLSQVAKGLEAAHSRQLVHRDLKPDNVFLCQTGDGDVVKILDFGSVKDKADNAKKLTVMGTTIGSPYYMAPEQAQGLETLDHRADVWAAAAIIYECVTGEVPFKGVNGPSILLEILTKEPVMPSLAAAEQEYPVPQTLDRALMMALRKQASLRTASIGELADAVGHAYGLEGNHQIWADTPQATLAAEIDARLPAILASSPPSVAPADAMTDDFFGEMDALGGMDQAAAQAPAPEPGRLPPHPGSAGAMYGGVAGQPVAAPVHHMDESPLGVPKQSSLLLLVVVGVCAMLLGVVVVVLILL